MLMVEPPLLLLPAAADALLPEGAESPPCIWHQYKTERGEVQVSVYTSRCQEFSMLHEEEVGESLKHTEAPHNQQAVPGCRGLVVQAGMSVLLAEADKPTSRTFSNSPNSAYTLRC